MGAFPQLECKPKVLIADDEHLIADTLAAILNQNGFEAVAVYCGHDAVRTAEQWQPDLLLSDVVMPGMDGIEAATRIRCAAPVCRVLLISGQASLGTLLDRCHASGHYFEMLSKPLHPEELIASIRRALTASAEELERRNRNALESGQGRHVPLKPASL